MTDHSASARPRDENVLSEDVLSIEKILVEEADAIHGPAWKAGLNLAPKGQDAQDLRKNLNRDRHEQQRELNNDQHEDIPRGEVERREELYRRLNELNRAALCCSGGGIRSATFCLGVIQALAECDVAQVAPQQNEARAAPDLPGPVLPTLAMEILEAVGEDAALQVVREWRDDRGTRQAPAAGVDESQKPAPAKRHEPIDPKNSLLGKFAYLSTVSGGGYVGSWLSSWRARDSFENIIANLTGRPSGADVEPPEISWLRAYSNYLTPRLGIGSADTWAAIAIVVRNLVLNWLVIIPVLCLVLLLLKIILTSAVWIAHDDDGRLAIGALLAGIIFLIGAQAFTTYHRPPRRLPSQAKVSAQPGNASQTRFLCGDFIWSAFSAIAVTTFFSSQYFWSLHTAGWPDFGFVKEVSQNGNVDLILVTAAAGFAIYLFGWLIGFLAHCLSRRLSKGNWRFLWESRAREFVVTSWDFAAWALSGLVYGALIGLGAALFTMLVPYPATEQNRLCLLLSATFGVPWVLMAQLTADNVFGGLVSYEPLSDSDREWLGRAAGWLSVFAIGWAILALLVFAVDQAVVDKATDWGRSWIAAAGGVSGIVTAFLGSSSLTPAKSAGADQTKLPVKISNLILAIAGPVFVAVLIVALSIGLDALLLRSSLVGALQQTTAALPIGSIQEWLWIGLAIAAAIALLASYFVNINRFSLHALYRNRLIRGYLGASRQQDRMPDLFTGLDSHDSPRMWNLWPPNGGKADVNCLFHVINITLNLVSTKRLAWQERKAEAFTVTPKHCGSANLGFRPSKDYGDSFTVTVKDQQGVALGTAMAISGAAASPNMGYASSPSLSILLTLFNVRLGWWLGNPGEAGNKHKAYRREGPRFSAAPLLFEALGQTTDDRPYVYLSDGGHFENLGLYEMVRRRCRFIVVIDAGCDADFTFYDLGNAVRKIFIDLGIRITFEGLDKLHNRPDPDVIKAAGKKGVPYHALGRIHYVEADGKAGDRPGCRDGCVLYIKPAYHGTHDAAGIRSYAMTSKTFPHETTLDQFFTESQFESYRSLGLDMTRQALRDHHVVRQLHDFLHPAPG